LNSGFEVSLILVLLITRHIFVFHSLSEIMEIFENFYIIKVKNFAKPYDNRNLTTRTPGKVIQSE
jgi:hypothetical protein